MSPSSHDPWEGLPGGVRGHSISAAACVVRYSSNSRSACEAIRARLARWGQGGDKAIRWRKVWLTWRFLVGRTVYFVAGRSEGKRGLPRWGSRRRRRPARGNSVTRAGCRAGARRRGADLHFLKWLRRSSDEIWNCDRKPCFTPCPRGGGI
jgi:hypothetical protein